MSVPRLLTIGLAVLAVGVSARALGAGPDLPEAPGTTTNATVTRPADDRRVAPPPLALRPSGDGRLVLPAPTDGAAPASAVTYTLEIEPALRAEAVALRNAAQVALGDQRRGWAHDVALRQVADPAAARIRVVLALPATADALCAEAGYYTGGRLSCWNGRFAVLNSWRWANGATGFDSLDTYRTYVINHEFGHGLGHMHSYCPAPGAPAPLMMQQTKGLEGCLANPWPYP